VRPLERKELEMKKCLAPRGGHASHANRLHSHDAEDSKRQHTAEVVSLH
jgi:hypothetical protein